MNHRRLVPVVLALALAVPVASSAEPFDRWNGHISIGYAKLFRTDAPGGSLSMGAGVDHPIAQRWSLGGAIGFHLLGSQNPIRGSLAATVDYSAFDAALLAHWRPSRWGIGRVSFGPALVSAKADLSSSGGGAAFSDLAVSKSAAGAALDLTLMPARERPVRVGLELGLRLGFLPSDTWTIADTRVAIHY